jgi:hypothetical protein
MSVITTFTLKSPTTRASAPFTIGQTFKKGDVASGVNIVGSIADLQVTPKNYWNDGSLKIAVISGMADLTANTPLTVTLSTGTPAAGTALTTTDLKATGVTASIDVSTVGTVSWATTDWDTPFQTWVSGPKMSSWIYRKAVGSDAHLVGFLEVRLFSNGEVEVLPWIENGFLKVASPSNKNFTYSFTLGGTSRFSAAIDLKHHQRTVLVSGTALSYWLGTDPNVLPNHDKAYMQASELVPKYGATVPNNAVTVTSLVTSFTPLQIGNIVYDSDSMASSGYQSPIGLLPQYDVMYLVTTSDLAYGAVVRNGYSGGRWAIHYRDENTNRPVRFSDHPTLNIRDNQGFKDTGGSTASNYTPVITGGNPPSWDCAHSPSIGYMAYLVTGRWYFMEEVQFVTTANYLGNGDNNALRTGSKGLVQTAVVAWQTRSCAWDWRARVQALCVTPDSDTAIRNEFINSVQENVDHFHGRYVAQPNNPFGYILPGEVYDTPSGLATGVAANWQQDFVTAAFGWSLSMDLPISSGHATKLREFFHWKAKSTVMRLGSSSGFWYINGAPYNVKISNTAVPDFTGGTGPWLANNKEVYDATFEIAPSWLGSTEGTLNAEYDPSVWAISMWGNIHPAIAYAVRHGVAGAATGYNRMISASNYSSLQTNFNLKPVWDVVPLLVGEEVPAEGTILGKSMRIDSADFITGYMILDDGCNGVLASEIPLTGTDGASLLANDIVPGDVSTHEYSVEMLSYPSAGVLLVDDDGAFSFTGAPNGTYTANQRVKIDGEASDTTLTLTVGAASTVTSVSVSPSTATVVGGATQAFTATVVGTGSPSQTVTWSTNAGSINSSTGLFTAPAATGSVQTITVTATSVQDDTKAGTATVTVPVASTVTSVSVSPSTATVTGAATQTFTATVVGTNSPSQAVTWSTTAGTINSSGLFTAPATSGSIQTITVTATSVQNGARSGTATVTVPAGSSTVTNVVVSPSTATVAASATQSFTAAVSGTFSPSQAVTWSTTAGSINSSGLFTAPAGTGSTQTITITATSVQDGSRTGTATVTIPSVTLVYVIRFRNMLR